MAVAIAAGIVIILAFFFLGFETPTDVGRSVLLALAATSFMLLYAGGEIALSFLFAWKRPIGVKVMHFCGALCAILTAFLVTPLALEVLADPKEKECKTIVKASIGPITISREDCDN
jgi:hypothetical protein